MSHKTAGRKDDTDTRYWSAWGNWCGTCGSEVTDAHGRFDCRSTCGDGDVAYVRAAVDAAKCRYNIDAKRVYAIGQSNGAAMAFRVGCSISGPPRKGGMRRWRHRAVPL